MRPLQERLRLAGMYLQATNPTTCNPQSALMEAADKIDRLEKALSDAARQLAEASELISEWGAYAESYFQDKHDLAGDVSMFKKYAAGLDEVIRGVQK